MMKNCENCMSFDNSKFLHKRQTKDAGLCTKFTEVTFKNDSCKFYLPKQNLTEKEIFAPVVDTRKTTLRQLDLFQ
ncbi:hypothetical protein CFS9_35810 [Flavobacterium sp. CFS9]|uniref:Uncharacterized protein n=1 Tax=Flavobacterium sp. CFS9 TaxID=3143118 RepID=A0AAT9H5J1_9FLAO